MGIEEPHLYFKTLNNGLDKYASDAIQRKVDLDMDENTGYVVS